MSPLAFALIVALVATGIFGLYLYIPVAAGFHKSKPLLAAAHAYTQHPEGSTMRILVMGDSTAVGAGGTPEESIAGRLGADFPQAIIVNDSKNGQKLEGFLAALRAHREEKYDLIVFQIGANDIVGLTSEASIRKNLLTALTYANDMASHTIILSAGNIGLAPVFKWPLSVFYSSRSYAVRSLYQEEIKKYPQMRYIDLYHDRAHEPFNTDVDRFYAADHFHPSGAGYGIWYAQIREALSSLLG